MDTLVETKLESLEEMVAKNSEDITALSFQLSDVRVKVAAIEKKVDSIEKTLETKADKTDIVRLEEKIDLLGNRLDQKIDKILEKMV